MADAAPPTRPLAEVAILFLKLGLTGFGGPAAVIAMMETEVVRRRRWLSHHEFIDLVGATNLIPGPNSTEMAMHIGKERAGWPGLFVAGFCFILPAALISAALAVAYLRAGALPDSHAMLAGIRPAVVVIIATALWRLGRAALRTSTLLLLAAAVTTASLAGLNEILVLFAGGIIGALVIGRPRRPPPAAIAAAAGWLAIGAAPASASTPLTLTALFLFFLKIGAVLYGSGYVLIAFLEGGLVDQHAWLTRAQLLDAIAAGQITPGPFLSTATFIGYILARGPGAVLATIAIFLPSFLFVALINPLIPRLRQAPATARFLDAINASSIGLMAAVTVTLGRSSLFSWQALLIATAAAGAAAFRVGPALTVAGAAILGLALF